MSRISAGTMTLGIVAVLFGLVGAYTVREYLQPEPAPGAPQPPAEQLVQVPLASIDLPAGKELVLGDVALVSMTAAEMQQRELPLDKTMLNPQQIIGRVLKGPVAASSPFLVTSLYPEGMGPSLADRLKPGLRAVTVPIAQSGALDGFAGPSSFVDVLLRTHARQDEGAVTIPEATFPLIEGVEVLAIGSNSTPGTRGVQAATTVTLAVTPEQAGILKTVEGRGTLSLALRSPMELTAATYRSEKITLEGLLGVEPEPKPYTSEIYRGTSRQTITFERDRVRNEEFGGVARATEPALPVTPASNTGGSTTGN